ncbi:vitamin K epoxide reductase family protein [Limnoglobus roseus]|uniref:vitamin K epoxide reductase family protein n=1 Tax=Limnoglobus roseus TaxID=2598579 RepID=UPI00143DF99F|nr:vitamin K epoxide reductase family protein [Limnoglobus roseus]
MTVVLAIAALDTIYLSWRFTALVGGWVTPGTGVCSWTARVDCDKVLQTPEARAFVVPNAVLGLGFYTGALLWWLAGRRLGSAYRPHLVRSLAVWLGIASLMTLWFWRLMFGLDWLCPFCPWNHVLTYAALYLAVRVWRLTPHPLHHEPLRPLLRLVAICILWFWAWQGLWFLAEATVLHRP